MRKALVVALVVAGGCGGTTAEEDAEPVPTSAPACTDMRPGTPVPESFSETGCILDGTLVPAGGLACPDGRQTYAVGTSPGVVGIEGGDWQPGVNEVEVLQALC